ncbi:MAG: J domain-containing protein [Methanomicrobiales archaeon]|nr:J domain-containing protein [Methanomicrobiales archaeon]
METHYDILGVSPDAAPDEIRAAYRKLAKQYHPDMNPDPDAGERFIAIQQAYETLIDPDARARYDLALRGGGAGAHDPFAWYRPGGQAPETRIGVVLLVFLGSILIVVMLALSFFLRAVSGIRRQQGF